MKKRQTEADAGDTALFQTQLESRRGCRCWNGSHGSGGRFNLCPHTDTLAAGAAVSCPSQTQGLQPPAEAGGIEKKKKGAERPAEHTHLS